MKNKKSGIIIPYLLVFGGILALILASLLGYISYRYEQSIRNTARSNALQAAEAGLNYYEWYVIHTLEGKTSAQIKQYWEGTPLGVPFYNGVLKNQAGATIGGYQIVVTPPDEGSSIIMVKVKGWDQRYSNIEREIDARLRKRSWGDFAVVGNDIMRFGPGTEVWGAVHSNNGIHFDGVAHNIVRSYLPGTYWDPDYGEDKPAVWTSLPDESQVFLAGKNYPATYKDFNSIGVDFTQVKDAAQNGGVYLPALTSPFCGYKIVLRTDHKFNLYKAKACGSVSYQMSNEVGPTVYDIPDNGVIFVEEKVSVEGTINGDRLTIAAANLQGGTMEDIYIFHSIRYTNSDGSDIIGLIAQNNVTIGMQSDDNLHIDAALVAQNGRVGRDFYNQSSSHTYYNRDTITLNGCIITNRRYGFAWVCGGNHCSGYRNRNIIYDNNLLYYPPAYFPSEDHYSIDLWEED